MSALRKVAQVISGIPYGQVDAARAGETGFAPTLDPPSPTYGAKVHEAPYAVSAAKTSVPCRWMAFTRPPSAVIA